MPLAAYAHWDGATLALRVALGHPERTDAPLLRASVHAPVANADEARRLGDRAADALRAQGASAYLAS